MTFRRKGQKLEESRPIFSFSFKEFQKNQNKFHDYEIPEKQTKANYTVVAQSGKTKLNEREEYRKSNQKLSKSEYQAVSIKKQ